jgi:hypothetical protein
LPAGAHIAGLRSRPDLRGAVTGRRRRQRSRPMNLVRSKTTVLLATLVAVLLATMSAWADGDWKLTGSGTRVKTIAIVDVNVYAISHYMKEIPATKTKQAVIDADTDKKFVWTMKRDVDNEKISKALTEAFAMNGYTDAGKIASFMGAFKSELKEKATVTISYDSTKKETTVKTDSGSATIGGVDFMKGVWSIWFAKIDQPKLGDALISQLK